VQDEQRQTIRVSGMGGDLLVRLDAVPVEAEGVGLGGGSPSLLKGDGGLGAVNLDQVSPELADGRENGTGAGSARTGERVSHDVSPSAVRFLSGVRYWKRWRTKCPP
jgi:hypothetical protein